MTRHPVLFVNNKEKWTNTLTQLQTYIQEHSKVPTISSHDPEVKRLGTWLRNQRHVYKKNIFIMKDPSTRHAWESFVENNKL